MYRAIIRIIHVYRSELRAARYSNTNTAPKTNEKKTTTTTTKNLSVQNLEKKPRAHTHQTREEKLRCEPTHRLKMGEREANNTQEQQH